VVSHQAGQTLISTDPPQEPGAVERVKPGGSHSGSVPYVMQPCRGDQRAIGKPERRSNMLRPVADALDVPPASR